MKTSEETESYERMVLPELDSSIGINGVRENDEFVLDIFQDRRRPFRLNRTRYIFKFDSRFEFDFLNAEIMFPSFGKASGTYELVLVTHVLSKNHNNRSRYLFRSLGDSPFRINGIYSFETFLERGDVIDLGLNRIQFSRPENETVTENVIPENFVKSPLPILLEGETGTGKTTFARKIHEESGRYGRFVHLNLSAFSSSLLESELFGHVKGAFTGALNSKKGAILEAQKGTLFLDEIDSISLDVQTKLLLFLDDHEVRVVGGENSIKADVRIIFASGTNLKKLVQQGKMRRDFYYRLQSGCSLTMKNLRESTERIKNFCRAFENQEMVVMDKELLEFYSHCRWPGNIRQLQSHLMKKKIYSGGKKLIFDDFDKELIADHLYIPKEQMGEVTTLEQMKIKYCFDVFLKMDKNITRTAKILEISPNTLKAYLAAGG